MKNFSFRHVDAQGNVLPRLEPIVAKICEDMQSASDRGHVASYISSLARVDPRSFGMAVATVDGGIVLGGSADVGFSIQSISKVFALTLALGKVGDQLWKRVGREPSGT